VRTGPLLEDLWGLVTSDLLGISSSGFSVLAYYLRTPSLPTLVPIRHVSQFFTATDGSDGRSLKRRLRPTMAASGSMAAGGGLLVQRVVEQPMPPSNLFFVAKALEGCDKPAPPPLQPQHGHAPSLANTSRPHHDPYHDPYSQQLPGSQPVAVKQGARDAFNVGPHAPIATCSLHVLSRDPRPQRQKLQQRSRSAGKSAASDKSHGTADGSVAPAVEAATEGDDSSAAAVASAEEQLSARAVADHVDMLASRLHTLFLLSSPASASARPV